MTYRSFSAAFAAAALIAGAAGAQEPASLTLTFDVGARNGVVSVALFDSQAAYDGGEPVRAAKLDVAAGQTSVTFDGLTPGTYAAKTMHDMNGDGKLDTNPFGMPTEPYGFTNNARGSFGPAKWDAAAVKVEGAVAQTVVLK